MKVAGKLNIRGGEPECPGSRQLVVLADGVFEVGASSRRTAGRRDRCANCPTRKITRRTLPLCAHAITNRVMRILITYSLYRGFGSSDLDARSLTRPPPHALALSRRISRSLYRFFSLRLTRPNMKIYDSTYTVYNRGPVPLITIITPGDVITESWTVQTRGRPIWT